MSLQNVLNNFLLMFPGVVSLGNVTFVRATINNSVAGNNDYYTCPAGRRALIFTGQFRNTNASTNTVIINWKLLAGTYLKLISSASFTLATNTSSTNYSLNGFILEAGEGISINSSLVGLNVSSLVVEYDNTSNLKMYRFGPTLASGDNTIYTCTGKGAIVAPFGYQPCFNNTANSGASFVSNGGLNPTQTWYLIPNGGSKSINNIVRSPLTMSGSVRTVVPLFTQMTTGDSILINSTSGLSNTYATLLLYEF